MHVNAKQKPTDWNAYPTPKTSRMTPRATKPTAAVLRSMQGSESAGPGIALPAAWGSWWGGSFRNSRRARCGWVGVDRWSTAFEPSARIRIPTRHYPLVHLGSTTGCQSRSVRLLDGADEADRDTADPYHQSQEGAERVQLRHDETQDANGYAKDGKGCASAQIDPSSPLMGGRDLVVSPQPSVHKDMRRLLGAPFGGESDLHASKFEGAFVTSVRERFHSRCRRRPSRSDADPEGGPGNSGS